MTKSAGALAVSVVTFSDPSLAVVQQQVNAFLAGKGAPVITSTTKLLQFDLRNDGTNYFAYVLYTEG